MTFSVFMQGVPGAQTVRRAHSNVFNKIYSKVGVTYVRLYQNKVVLRLLAFLRSKKLSTPNSTFDVLRRRSRFEDLTNTACAPRKIDDVTRSRTLQYAA